MSLKTLGKGILVLSLVNLPTLAHADLLTGSTALWNVITSGGNGIWDPANDQQTGQPEGDFVGVTNSIPSSYAAFINTTPLVNTDGSLYIRSRHRGDTQSPDFSGYLWVGIEANGDSTLDIFIGANRQGSQQNFAIEIRNPGTSSNSSPSTTSISNSTLFSTPLTATNYNWSAVSATNYAGTDFDADNEGLNDYFLSFAIPFQQIVTNLNTVGQGRPVPISITDQTSLKFVLMTSTQTNSINQDFNGLAGTTGSYPFNDPTSPGGFQVTIPEPSTLAFLLPGLFFLRRRRK